MRKKLKVLLCLDTLDREWKFLAWYNVDCFRLCFVDDGRIETETEIESEISIHVLQKLLNFKKA